MAKKLDHEMLVQVEASFIYLVESFRQLKWWLTLRLTRKPVTPDPDRGSRAAILHASARNVRRYALFTRRSPKEIFLELY